jgi:hypothetical protein
MNFYVIIAIIYLFIIIRLLCLTLKAHRKLESVIEIEFKVFHIKLYYYYYYYYYYFRTFIGELHDENKPVFTVSL